jgi:acyl phosphate:glycerol-3-phosphate acyltransferase
MTIIDFLLIPLAYLVGSIPTAVWVGRFSHGIDIREHGSGNAGATNTIRVLGYKWGIPVLIFDVFKGFIAVSLVHLSSLAGGSDAKDGFSIILGILAVCGHIWPAFAGFRGGKGVATIFGVILALQLIPTLIAIGVFLICLIICKYVSVSSMVAGLSFPVSMYFVHGYSSWPLTLFSFVVPALLIYTHRKNIKRLRNGKEGKADFIFGKKACEKK